MLLFFLLFLSSLFLSLLFSFEWCSDVLVPKVPGTKPSTVAADGSAAGPVTKTEGESQQKQLLLKEQDAHVTLGRYLLAFLAYKIVIKYYKNINIMIWARKKRGIQKNWELVIWNLGYLLIGTEWFGIYVFGTGDPHIAERGVYFRRGWLYVCTRDSFQWYLMLPYATLCSWFLGLKLPVSGKESETRLLQSFYVRNFYETHGEPMVNQWWTNGEPVFLLQWMTPRRSFEEQRLIEQSQTTFDTFFALVLVTRRIPRNWEPASPNFGSRVAIETTKR